MVREWPQQDQLADVGTGSPKASDTNLLRAAFSRRPVGTVLVLLLLLTMPVIFRGFSALAHGDPFRAGDWYAILIGEALAALVLFVIWRKSNWFR
jgi:Na+-driven multidrug efflux pump